MFLEMIIKSLSNIDDTTSINATKLYETYTNDWIIQQSKRRGAVMSKDQRIKFVKLLSTKLYYENISELHFSQLHKLAEKLSGYTDATRVDYFDTDARTSTFITKSSDGHYGFRHRSFMEYFCATVIKDSIINENDNMLNVKIIPNEVMEFISGLEFDESGFRNLEEWSKNFEKPNVSKNAVSLLKIFNRKLPKEVAKHYSIDDSDWELLNNAQSDNQALEELYKRYYDELFLYGMGQSKIYGMSQVQVEDAIQELMLSLWVNREKTKLDRFNLRQYLHISLKRILFQRERLHKKEFEVSLNDSFQLSIENEIEEKIMHEERIQLLYEILEELDERDKEILNAFYFQKLTIKDIADKFGYSINTIKQLKYRALKKLREIAKNKPGIEELFNV